MALLIGMDEAGYGPNLGPLVVGATAWEVTGDPRKLDLWQAFAGIVDRSPPADGSHIQVADSKEVYTPARGLANLEHGVLNAVCLHRSFSAAAAADGTDRDGGGLVPASFRDLIRHLATEPPESLDAEPWFSGNNVDLPARQPFPLADRWLQRCQSKQIRLRALRSDVVLTRRFNEQTRARDSKGQALSEISMNLLRQVWNECRAEEHDQVLILADKHGGRSRYQEFLPIVFGDLFIRCHAESMNSSRYRVGNAEIRFETKSERHLPVALASMVCKYLRELSMQLFNRFWTDRQPGLKPTAGYPLDARRFKDNIAGLQQQLGISDEILWRER